MPPVVLLEPYSLDIYSSLIGRSDIIVGVNWLCTYRTKMIGKDLKVSLRYEDWLNVRFYESKEEKPYLSPQLHCASKWIIMLVMHWILVICQPHSVYTCP